MLQTRVETAPKGDAAETLVTSQGCKVSRSAVRFLTATAKKKSLALAGWCAGWEAWWLYLGHATTATYPDTRSNWRARTKNQ